MFASYIVGVTCLGPFLASVLAGFFVELMSLNKTALANPSTDRRSSVTPWMSACGVASALGVAFLVLATTPIMRNFLAGMGGTAVLASIRESGLVWPLLQRVGAFILVALMLHIALGLCAVGLTWLTEHREQGLAAQRVKVVFLWFVALAIWICAANAYWFPRSELVPSYAGVVHFDIGPANVFHILTAALSLPILWLAVRPLAFIIRRATLTQKVVSSAMLVGVVFAPAMIGSAPASTGPYTSKPHIILVGADSLRLDQLRSFGGQGNSPVLDSALRGARVFTDTTTPLARTFPSWVSILTGRHPRETGASFNLIAREAVRPAPTLAHLLKAQGYRTVFATDEVRFSNIDASYGFDTLVTPVIGASDFVIGGVADIPLLNVVNRTPLAPVLFPDIHANRAAAHTYRPADFDERLAAMLEFDAPTFLAVHFTASHWPYTWADSSEQEEGTAFENYQTSVRAVDHQIGVLLKLLKKHGALEDAVVVFLSDHGEALKQPGDTLIREADAETARRLVAHQQGHGTSVLSPSQYQVLLAFAGFGAQSTIIMPGTSDEPASLEDIAPTLLELLDVPVQAVRFDGRSLAGLLSNQQSPLNEFSERVRFTETDFTLPRMLAGDFNVKWLVQAGVPYYRIHPTTGWVELKPERLSEITANKERAAILGPWLMAAVPTTTSHTLYAIAHRDTGTVRIVADPENDDGPYVAHLYRALHARFPSELGQPARLASADADRMSVRHSNQE